MERGSSSAPERQCWPTLASLLEDVNIFFAELRIRILGVVLIDELREPQSTGHARRTAADDDNVGRHLRTFDVRERLAEN